MISLIRKKFQNLIYIFTGNSLLFLNPIIDEDSCKINEG